MGCTQSKIENEEAVNRCKERKQHMERAVTARNKFAAAHSAHAMSLKNTGAALSDFAQGEVIYPPRLPEFPLGHPTAVVGANPLPPVPPYEKFPPPPPPLPSSIANTSPLQRAATMPEFSIPRPENKHSNPIIEEEDEEDAETESSHSLKRRSSKAEARGGILPQKVTEDEVFHQPRVNAQLDRERKHHPPPPPVQNPSWDYFFQSDNVPPTLADVEENSAEREEIEREMLDERSRRKEMENKAEKADKVQEVVSESPPQPPPQAATKAGKRAKQAAQPDGKRKSVGSNVNLLKIFVNLDDYFLKASESAHEVSRMLEATRLHYHSNFADKRGHINHSERVMRVISWNRSFRGLGNGDDEVDEFDSDEHKTHATVLDKILAWEKKLYDEVKAGEEMKFEYRKKVSSLNRMKKRSSNTDALERTKAAVSHLHTRYIVDMQSMDSTVSEINRLLDEQLYPILVALIDAMATMWETIRVHNESQSQIVQSLKLLDISQSSKETTEHHHDRTRQLGGIVQEWSMNLAELMNQQREYIRSLNHWLKLNLIPIDTNLKENLSSPDRPQKPPIQTLLLAWRDHLEKLPDEPAKAAINSFAAVVKTIWQYQKEELEYKSRCVESRKEFERKEREFGIWYNKYMQKRTTAVDLDQDRAIGEGHIAEKQMVVEMAKHKVEDAEEAYEKQCVQVREKSLGSLKTHLPELFRAFSVFSLASSDMYRNLSSIAHSLNGKEVTE